MKNAAHPAGTDIEKPSHGSAENVLIVANPYSGARRNRAKVQALVTALERRGLSARVEWNPPKREQLFEDASYVRSCRCVVAAGGDGTVAGVINARPPMPLAVLPLGVENLFARHFGLTTDADAVAETVIAGTPVTIDLGRAGDIDFSLLVSAGFDAEVVHRVGRRRAARKKLRRITHLSYLRPILSALWHYDYPLVELDADGDCVSGVQAFVFNLPCYAVRLAVAPHARADDGMLDWVVLQRPGFWNLQSYFRAMRRSRHLSRPDVRHGRARKIRISGPCPVPVEVDGDPVGFTPVVLSVTSSALRVMTR